MNCEKLSKGLFFLSRDSSLGVGGNQVLNAKPQNLVKRLIIGGNQFCLQIVIQLSSQTKFTQNIHHSLKSRAARKRGNRFDSHKHTTSKYTKRHFNSGQQEKEANNSHSIIYNQFMTY